AVSEAARPAHYFNNLAVDSLLYHYISTAKKKGYDIKIQIEVPKNIPIHDEVSFCTILGNLLENALEACERQTTGKHFIHLFVRWQHGNIHILLENSFDGAITTSRNGYFSRKHEGEGIGIISVRKLTEKLGGTAEFLPERNVFQAMLVLPADE
ncbi:MAG: sensor histidine kinase, partial [Lachnospiraceae bacterium]|nr:sensor histidine kinase [Lachnospiraceae bacterium]